VPIYPVAKYLAAEERGDMPAPMKPVSFAFSEHEIHVDSVRSCVRGVSRKAGGRGFRYACKVSWKTDERWRTKESVLWYDDFLQEWFVEVPESKAPPDWHKATRVSDIVDFYS
jgi:hypothetical protein